MFEVNIRKNQFKIRKISCDDVGRFARFLSQIDGESEYLLYDDGERVVDDKIISNFIAKIAGDQKSIIFLALDAADTVVGYVCGEVLNLMRVSHVMRVNIAILKEYRRFGLGRYLGQQVIDYAKVNGITRLESTVITENKPSYNLCLRVGMKLEGVKQSSIKINDLYYDEYLLSKVF